MHPAPFMEDKKRTKSQLISELEDLRKCVAHLERCKARFQKKKKQLDKRLLEYEKLSALGRLTANVAHEIRNPVTVIGGLARRLGKFPVNDAQQKEYLQSIAAEAKRLEDILKDVLSFSDSPVFQRTECDINELANECLKKYRKSLKERSITVTRSFSDIPRIYVAKKEVKEAVNNLLMNAADAMPQGGIVTVSTTRDHINQRSYAVLKVSDTGMGIPAANMHLIFEPFFTTKANKQETGLGLSITKKVVELHSGLVNVESTVGKGSTFSLYFPYRSKS